MAASLQRRINYLRLSITDRCNLRCVYCTYRRAWELAALEILQYEELLHLVRAAAALGITKVRVTGGEPPVRGGTSEHHLGYMLHSAISLKLRAERPGPDGACLGGLAMAGIGG